MTERVVKPRPGRQKPVDEKVVEGMASVGATNVEIAEFLGVSEALIRKRCKQILLKARASLRTRLRQAQIKTALGGNPAMLIWLGKQMLEQRDRHDHEVTGADRGAMEMRVVHQVIDPQPVDEPEPDAP